MSGAGAVPYYTRWYTVDRLGLNDATLARQPVAVRGLPGHERDAGAGYLAARRVALNDALNRIVYDGERERLRERLARSGVPDLRCLAAEGRYLVFTTTLSDAEFARLFQGFEPCW